MDISNMTLDQLETLQRDIAREMQKRKSSEKLKVVNELRKLAKEKGYVLEELLSEGQRKPPAKKTVPIKFRHPQNPDLTWSGRGLKPKWIVEWEASHKSLDGVKVPI